VFEQGTPLVEPDPTAVGFSLVTFLWIEEIGLKSAILKISIDGLGEDTHEMTRLGGTKIWFLTVQLRDDYRGSYKFALQSIEEPEEEWNDPDPANRNFFIEPRDGERPDHSEDDIDSVVELPEAKPRTWAIYRPEVKVGKVERVEFRSRHLGNERRIWVYSPPDYEQGGGPHDLLLVLDGRFFTFAINTPVILDNLLAEKQIPSLVAVLVDNPGATWEESMAVREKELSCFPPFAEFLVEELIPWIRQNYPVTLDPKRTTIAGGSMGGLAAVFSSMLYPKIFGNALSLSGSFWWKPKGDDEWEWLARQYATRPYQPQQIYLEVGSLESWPTPSGFPGQVLANRHLRNVLRAKGYKVYYEEQMHGHDSFAWQAVIPEGLMAVTQRTSG